MIIDCDGCRARGPACADCVITVLLAPPHATAGPHPADAGAAGRRRGRQEERADRGSAGWAEEDDRWGGPRPEPVLVSGPRLTVRGAGSVHLDAAERAAIAVLAGSGLVPPLRVVPPAPDEVGSPPPGARRDGDARAHAG